MHGKWSKGNDKISWVLPLLISAVFSGTPHTAGSRSECPQRSENNMALIYRTLSQKYWLPNVYSACNTFNNEENCDVKGAKWLRDHILSLITIAVTLFAFIYHPYKWIYLNSRFFFIATIIFQIGTIQYLLEQHEWIVYCFARVLQLYPEYKYDNMYVYYMLYYNIYWQSCDFDPKNVRIVKKIFAEA